VNGKEISLDDIKRHTLLVSYAGRLHVELAKLQIPIDREMRRQIAEDGKTVADYAISQESIDEAVDHFAPIGKSPHIPSTVGPRDRNRLHEYSRRAEAKQWLLFKRIFLPDNPYHSPPITAEALGAARLDLGIFGIICDNWDRKQSELGQQTESAPGTDRMIGMMLATQVVQHLLKSAEVRDGRTEIPGHLLCVVDGVGISVDAIWKEARNSISKWDVWRAKQWLVITSLLLEELNQTGFLLSRDEATAIWKQQAIPNDCWNIRERSALNIKEFPTMGMYRTYHRLYESFKSQIAGKMTDEVLAEQGRRRVNAIVDLATVDVDVILLSAFDFEQEEWSERGWQNASEQSIEVSERLAAGEDWDLLLDEYSAFYDPPLPAEHRDNVDVTMERFNKGRFRERVRNRLMAKLDEPEFLQFLCGNSVTDIIFFEMKVGSIENPIRGPYGYYIPRLLHRSAPTKQLSATDPSDRRYLENDYITERLRLHAQELLADAIVTGL